MKVIKWNGKPVTKSGVYSGVPLDVYHSDKFTAGKSVSSSNLRDAWKSMAHMFARWAHNPNAEPFNETESMLFGRAGHHLFLGEDDFSTLFVQQPLEYRDAQTAELKPWHNGAKWCKAWHAQMRDAGRTVLTKTQLDKIKPMTENLRLDPLVQAGGFNGLVEHSMVSLDKETGLFVKWRPDCIPNDGDYTDLKLTNDVTDLAVMKSLRSYRYNMQGGLGWEVCEQLGLPFTSFTLLLVETENPFCVRSVPLDDEDLRLGRLQCRAMMRRVAHCIEAGHWPGPGEGEIRPIPLSKAERENIEFRLSQLGIQ